MSPLKLIGDARRLEEDIAAHVAECMSESALRESTGPLPVVGSGGAGSLPGAESAICPACRGLCGEANDSVNVFYPCKTCGGTGSVRAGDSRKENDPGHPHGT